MISNYYIYKFSSDMLDDELNINTTIEESLKKDEVVGISNSHLIRTIIKQDNYNQISLGSKNKIFISELVSVYFKTIKKYDSAIERGIVLNGIKYVRLMVSPSQGRKSVVLFVKKDLFEKIFTQFIAGANFKKGTINPNKFNAYFSLVSSGGVQVTKPRVVVIDDYETPLIGKVKYVDDNNNITTREIQDLGNPMGNRFDGAGIITPEFAHVWSKDILGEKYNPEKPFCSFVERYAFEKGVVNTCDFIEIARDLNLCNGVMENVMIKDIWGKNHCILNIDIIISRSMLKLNTDFYESYESYDKFCEQSQFEWSVVGTNKLIDDEMNTLNYQYLQTLDIKKDDIPEICEYHAKLITDIKGGNIGKLLLFLSSSLGTDIFDNENTAPFIKILMEYPEIIKDSYVQNKINAMIKNTVKKMSIGKILVQGNYQIVIFDPYAQVLHALGENVVGLLKEREYYSSFWNRKKIKEVMAERSPLTDYSEHQVLNLVINNMTEKYYRYLYSGIIYPIYGMDAFVHSGFDGDGDNIFTMYSKILQSRILKHNKKHDIFPTYHSPKKAPKIKLVDENGVFDFRPLYEADKKSFGNEIGFVANYGSSIIALLGYYNKKKYPIEYAELRKRLTALYRESGNSIDKAKGIDVTPFPSHWKSIQKIQDDDILAEKDRKIFENKLAIIKNKKPLFMIGIYENIRKEYMQYYNSQKDHCIFSFKKTLDELLIKERNTLTLEEQKFLFNFEKYSPVYMNNCVMNDIYNYINSLGLDKTASVKNNDILKKIFKCDKIFPLNNDKFISLREIYNSFKLDKYFYKMNKIENNEEYFAEMFYNNVRQKINKLDIDEHSLLEWVFKISYFSPSPNKDFLWEVYGDLLFKKIHLLFEEKHKLSVTADELGELEYLGRVYTIKGGEQI